MGMYCTLRRAGEDVVRQLVANPADVGLFLHGPPPVVRRVRPPGLLGFVLRLLPIEVTEVDPSSPAPSASGDDVLDLEKSWHGLHFLFTGTASEGELPSSFLMRGGTEIDDGDDENVARVLNPVDVHQVDRFLQSLSRSELAKRYDARSMTALDIYPEIWARDTALDHPGLDHLLDAFEDLQAFIRETRERGESVVVLVS